MEILNIPVEHVGVTWFVIISPLLLILVYASVDHVVRRPPEILVVAYNALLRTKKNMLYIQALKLENSRLKARITELEGDKYTDQVTDLEYEEMTELEQWRERQRWKEHSPERSDFDIEYDITSK